MGAYDTAFNEDETNTLANTITQNAEAVNTQINAIYSEIGKMNTSWTGTGYDTFANGVESYHTAMNAVPTIMNNYAEALKTTVVTAGKDFINGAKDALDNIQ